ncbi:hypothetical protein [Yinghuangia sp. YIM S09857]|uniref:hypothetical protein n=1 Tax=Yinghuangia sp. YIM S09857 TaxID=3436929 RepID=UPI003F533E2C
MHPVAVQTGGRQQAVHHPVAHPPLGPHGAAQRFAADAVRAAVDALAFAEAQWDLEAWRAAHAAALDLVVLLAAIGPGPEVLLNSAAATLDNARRLVDSGNTQGGEVGSVPTAPVPW